MLTPIRKAIARHMTFSKQNIPHYYLSRSIDIAPALARREEWNASRAKEEQVSINDLVVKATALALAEHPEFNGYYQDEEFKPQGRVNIGIAIAMPDGLIAPAILDCAKLTLAEIARRSRDLSKRARAGTIKAEEYTDATFTVTNLGMFGVDQFTAIIVPPQVGILAVGAVREAPALVDEKVIALQVMTLTLSADHRATDGVEGAKFLGEIVSCMQNPERLFV